MDFDRAIWYLKMLPQDPAHALSALDIRRKMYPRIGSDVVEESRRRAVHRHLAELKRKGIVGCRKDGKVGHYYLHESLNVITQLMTDAMALQLTLSSDVLSRAIGPLLNAVDDARKIPEKISRLQKRIRVVADGIGRMPTRIEPGVLKAVIDAILDDTCVRLEYRNSGGQSSNPELTPLALVAKDGTLYLVAHDGRPANVRSYALQRVLKATQAVRSAVHGDFDIDGYIHKTHQFGHPVPVDSFPLAPVSAGPVAVRSAQRPAPVVEMLDLEIRVAPRALFHFRERPMTPEQTIEPAPGRTDEGDDADPDTWSVVHARVPYSVLLLPWLLSLAGWIRVDAPTAVRDQMQIVVGEMAKVYAKRAASGEPTG